MQLRELVTRYIILRNSDIVRNLVQPFIKTFLQPTPEFTQLQSEAAGRGKRRRKKKKEIAAPAPSSSKKGFAIVCRY